MGKDLANERSGAVQDPSADGADATAAAQWQRTLWAMVGVQFIMTMAFSVLSAIMPLLLPEQILLGILVKTPHMRYLGAKCTAQFRAEVSWCR
jgi:hypothetical protein